MLKKLTKNLYFLSPLSLLRNKLRTIVVPKTFELFIVHTNVFFP